MFPGRTAMGLWRSWGFGSRSRKCLVSSLAQKPHLLHGHTCQASISPAQNFFYLFPSRASSSSSFKPPKPTPSPPSLPILHPPPNSPWVPERRKLRARSARGRLAMAWQMSKPRERISTGTFHRPGGRNEPRTDCRRSAKKVKVLNICE